MSKGEIQGLLLVFISAIILILSLQWYRTESERERARVTCWLVIALGVSVTLIAFLVALP